MKKGSNWKCHPNDHMNVHMWTLEHHENVFFLQEENKNKGLTLHNWHTNTIANWLVVGVWA